jgi:7-cyano-7-deazaguanine synthase
MKAITLLSGGLDSFVSTAIARKKHKIVLALTFDYGQRAARREISAARRMCRMWRIPHKVIKLPWLGKITKTALVKRSRRIPHPPLKDLNDRTIARSHYRTSSVWVPNRNAVFINIAAAFAEAFRAHLIVTGFNKEEGAAFPDNSKEFVAAINKSLHYSTLERFSPLCKRGARGDFNYPVVISFTQNMTKRDMVSCARSNRLPLELCWPCYEGGKELCGRCESCTRFFNGVRFNYLTYFGDGIFPSAFSRWPAIVRAKRR